MISERRTTINRSQRSGLASGAWSLASGFTLIELLVAVALLGMAMAMTFTTFYSVAKAWQRGTAMADNLGHGEYVMQQITCGLRSSFYPPSQTNNNQGGSSNGPSSGGGYGFVPSEA